MAKGGRGRRQPRDADVLVEALLHAAEKPLSTYEIRDRLAAQGERVSIPLVYRAVSRLLEEKRIRRVETLNGYMPSAGGDGDAIAICKGCSSTVPIAVGDLRNQIAAFMRLTPFEIEEVVIEVHVRCPRCSFN